MKKLLSTLALAACTVVGGHAQAADKIKVGILLPLTGTFAAVAETQKEGALLAVDVVNKRGGLNMPGGKVHGRRHASPTTRPSRMSACGATATCVSKASRESAARPGRRWPTPSMPWSARSRCPTSRSA